MYLATTLHIHSLPAIVIQNPSLFFYIILKFSSLLVFPNCNLLSNKFSYPHNLNQLYSVIINISGARSVVHSGSAKRMTHLVRPTSPKSPVASASAYGSLEGSDEDDVLQDDPKLDTIYLDSNGNIVSQSVAVKVVV